MLFIDRSSNKAGSRAWIILESPTHEKFSRAFRPEFVVSNNEAEYKALIIGPRIAKDLDIKNIMVFYDSSLVLN